MGLLELEGVEVVGDGVVGGVLEVCREKERDDDVSDEEALEDTNATACRAGGSPIGASSGVGILPARLYRLIFSVAMMADVECTRAGRGGLLRWRASSRKEGVVLSRWM